MRQVRGFFCHDGRLDRNLLRVGLLQPDITHTEHFVADFEIGHARTQGAHHAGEIAARYVRQVGNRRIRTGAHFPVGTIDAGGVNIHQHLTRRGDRVFDLAVFHHLGPAVFIEVSRFHFDPFR